MLSWRRIFRLIAANFLTGAAVLLAWPAAQAADFSAVAAIFQKHCLDCHAVQDPEGKLVLETHETLLRGGESGPSIVPGKSGESLLARMIEGKFEKDGKVKFMPPGKRDKLSAGEIALIKAWIDEGAKPPAEAIASLKDLVVPDVKPKSAPRRPALAMAYDSSGKRLAVGRIGAVEIYAAEPQTLQRSLEGPAGNVNALAFSPDGQRLFAAGGHPGIEGEIKIWKMSDGTVERSIAGHHDSIYALALSPDGKMLATGSYDQKIKLWNAETGEELRTLSGHNGCVYGLAFRADGKLLASASGDRTIKLWDTASGERRDTLSQPLKEQYAVVFSADGKKLAAGGVDNRIRVWEISEEARETTNPLLISKFAHENAILRLALSRDGKSLASAAEDRKVKLWEFDGLKEKRAFDDQPDWAAGLAFVLEDRGLAVGRLDGSIAFYDTASGGALQPPAPQLAGLEPRGIQRGTPAKVKASGKHLRNAASLKFSEARIQAQLAQPPAPEEAWFTITADPSLPRGAYECSVVGANGESGKLMLHVDDLPQVIENPSSAATPIPSLPATVWGAHAEPGDVDRFEFEVPDGATIVFDAAARPLGSKADLVLTLLDASGKILASGNGYDSSSDPLLVHTFAQGGRYALETAELVLAGSASHYYRIAIGGFPFVNAIYPPVIAKDQRAVTVAGYNLAADPAARSIPLAEEALAAAEKSGAASVPVQLDPERFRWRGELRARLAQGAAAVEAEPNDASAQASTLPAPGIASGQMLAGDKEDWFRFESKAGQEWIIETAAAQLGSPMDTKLEIRDAAGRPVPRVRLRAVRDSAITFRGIDSTAADCRVENWEEMELNQYLYLEGEVVRLFRAPQGPDSGFVFYTRQGRRRNYFDTTATAHSNGQPCYIVEAHPPGAALPPNGLSVFDLSFQNDDDADRKLGSDSKIHFTAPADGAYFARVTDTRGFGGDRYLYTLAARAPQPGFKLSVEGMNLAVPRGSGQRFAVNAERIDGFEGEIRVEISGVPEGFRVSTPIIIEAGHTAAFGTLHADENARASGETSSTNFALAATAQIAGQAVRQDAGTLGKITVAEAAPLFVSLEPSAASPGETAAGMNAGQPLEITIAPGGIVPAWLKIRRAGHGELVTFQVENLPHGVIVDNIGLNGVLIPKDQNEREIFFRAERWVPESDRLCYAVCNEAGRQTSRPVLFKVRKDAGRVASRN